MERTDKIMLGNSGYKINEIYNEDCFEALKKIPDNSIDCIYVDVPYLYQSGGSGKGDLADRFSNRNAQLKEKNIYYGFDYEIFIKEAFRIMKGCNLFIWCSSLQLLDIMNEIKKIYKGKPIYTHLVQNKPYANLQWFLVKRY